LQCKRCYIPPLIIYKGIRCRDLLGDGLLPGAAFGVTENGYINVTVLLKWLEHFQNRAPGKCLVILDCPASHYRSIHVLDFCIKGYSVLMCMAAHCTHSLATTSEPELFQTTHRQLLCRRRQMNENNGGRNLTKQDTFFAHNT